MVILSEDEQFFKNIIHLGGWPGNVQSVVAPSAGGHTALSAAIPLVNANSSLRFFSDSEPLLHVGSSFAVFPLQSLPQFRNAQELIKTGKPAPYHKHVTKSRKIRTLLSTTLQ